MPRSPKAPPLPPEPDINEIIQNDVAKIKRLLGLDVNRLALGSEVEGIVTGGPFGSYDYTITGVNVIEFVNVSSTVAPSQTNAPQPPAQVTGLNVTVAGNNQLNLTWTASTDPGLTNYNIYRSLTTGTETLIDTSLTNSYSDITVNAGTTYYYKVGAVSNAGEGTLSAEDSATTTGSPPTASPTLWMALNNSYSDSMGLNSTFNRIAAGNTAFATAGVFGSHYAQLNIPSIPNTITPDHIGAIDNINCQLDFTNGFSFSLWIKPSDITPTSGANSERVIITKGNFNANNINIGIDSTGRLFGDINFSSTHYHKRDTVAISTTAFTHVVVTFNPTTNTLLLYKNKVSQTTVGSLTSTQLGGYTNLTIGHDSYNADLTTYEGAIDELQYFKVVLTQTQVNNLFTTNTP